MTILDQLLPIKNQQQSFQCMCPVEIQQLNECGLTTNQTCKPSIKDVIEGILCCIVLINMIQKLHAFL